MIKVNKTKISVTNIMLVRQMRKKIRKMKIKATLLIVLLTGMQQLIAQNTPSQKIDEFIQQKGDGFNIAYDKKDEKAYNALL